jgi:uncharacterized NAD(P)/FAD-binding protein YdhS
MQRQKVVVVGGGLSGVLVAIQLAAIENGPEVILLEKDPEKLGRGVAYQQEFTHQPLNVVAGSMSLFADKPDDFVKWMEENSFRYSHLVKNITPASFVPRKIFGDYVVERLKAIHDQMNGHFQIRIDEAISIIGAENSRAVVLGSGVTLQANHVILALGNFPPADVLPGNTDLKNNGRYFSNPWTDKVYQNIHGNEQILLLGTGLTAVDIVLGFHLRKFSGRIIMLSRKGRLPLPHSVTASTYLWKDPYLVSPLELFKLVRKNIKENPGLPWTAILDGLRPYTQKIWSFWSVQEKSVFLKKFRTFWEIARHRIPEVSFGILKGLIESGGLETVKGSIISVTGDKEGIETLFSTSEEERKMTFHKIINCTGPESNYRKLRFPIIVDLMERGKVVPDPLGLGIICSEDGNIINKKGEKEDGLWCIGPMRKAVLWETTALREIREQATQLTKMVSEKIMISVAR